MYIWRKKGLGLFSALLAVVLLGAGCAPAGSGGETPTGGGESSAPSYTDQTQPSTVPWTAATVAPGVSDPTQTEPGAEEPGELSQIRLKGMPSGWWQSFAGEDGCFFVAASEETLRTGLESRGIDLSKLDLSRYDTDFFADNRVAVIPRTANTGSVQYACTLQRDADSVYLTVTAQVPEFATTDMADFLLLVALPTAQIPADAAVTVDPAGNPGSGSGGANLAIE